MTYYYFMEVYHNTFNARVGKVVEQCQTHRHISQAKLVAAYKAYCGMLKSRLTRIEIYGPAQRLTEGL